MRHTEQGFPHFPLTFLCYLKTVIMSLLYLLWFSLKILIFSCSYLVCKVVTILVILSWAYSSFQSPLAIWSWIIGSQRVGSAFLTGVWKDPWRCPSTGLAAGWVRSAQKAAPLCPLCLFLVEGSWGGWNFAWGFSFRMASKRLYHLYFLDLWFF